MTAKIETTTLLEGIDLIRSNRMLNDLGILSNDEFIEKQMETVHRLRDGVGLVRLPDEVVREAIRNGSF